MAKEFFAYPETRQLFETLNDISRRSGVSRGQAFEDVLRASVAALAAETMEPEYFDAIKAHTEGVKGKRGVDLFPVFFGQAVGAMTQSDNDVLGDLFQGAISYGENGLYITPQPVAALMARLSVELAEKSEKGDPPTIFDPCCGPGILLLEAAKIIPRASLVGQDIDARCAQIASINLGLRQKYGWIICGNTLTRDVQFVYRIGSFFHESPNGLRRGVLREVPPDQCPVLPELRSRTRRDVLDTVDTEPPVDAQAPSDLSPIIEIPDWLLRMEARLAANDAQQSDDRPPAPTDADSAKQREGEPNPPKQKQQRLF